MDRTVNVDRRQALRKKTATTSPDQTAGVVTCRLSSLVEPIPKPVFKKRKKGGEFSPEVKREIDIRSGGLCEGKDCPDRTGGGWPLAYAHRYRTGKPNRGMGGTRREPTADDGWKACQHCHSVEDHHG